MNKTHVSASAIEKFSLCPVRFAVDYDDERSVTTRNDRSDVGTLIHAAREKFLQRIIDAGDNVTEEMKSFEQLKVDFEEASRDLVFAEGLEAYKRGEELLASCYRMLQAHPTIPIHLARWLAVEQELIEGTELWELDEWPLPMKGSIDALAIVPWLAKEAKAGEDFVLWLEDVKSGRPKTWEELTTEDVQPAIYVLYARYVLVPWLAAQGIVIRRIILGWTYLDEGIAVPMYEQDFNHETTIAYVRNISLQIIEFQQLYNAKLEEIGSDSPTRETQLNEWFSDYEKPNRYCTYCPRKNVCQTFQRLMTYEAVVVLDANINWDEFNDELDKFAAIGRAAEDRVDTMRAAVKLYLDQEHISAIPLSGGRELVANQQTRKDYRPEKVREVFGDRFILENARITDKSIKAELAKVSTYDADRAREMEAALSSTFITVPGARPVKARLTDEGKKASRRK